MTEGHPPSSDRGYVRYAAGSRRRRARRNGSVHWGRMIIVLVVLVLLILVSAFVGSIVALSRNMPQLDAMKPAVLAQTTFIYDRHGVVIAELHGDTNRIIVTSRQIPQVMKEATVAIEDRRFYQHHGVDFQGIARAIVDDIKAGHVVEGASTITEQFVKNAYVGNEQTLARKLREAVLAWQLENKWSKDKILTEYLNSVYYGAGAYGVEAAAETYFHKPISRVNLPQAALLAALPKFPSEYSPIYDPAVVRQRRNLVLDEMVKSGYISTTQAARAKRAKLGVFKAGPNTEKGPAAYFVDYVTRELISRYGARETFEGGLKVYTSLDLAWQRDAIDTMKGTLPSGPQGALVSIDPTNGFIRTMSATTDWRTTKFNVTFQGPGRQPGSAMKPFALIAAVEQGANPATTYYTSHPLHIPTPGGNPPIWDVYTFSHSTGQKRMNLVSATLASDNTIYAQLALDLGPRKIVAVAKKMGITTPLYPYPSIVLGAQDVTPLEMADAYATLASGGIHHKPQPIERVVFPNKRVERAKVKGKRVLSQGVAYVVQKILEQNTRAGTAAAMPAYYSGIAAGKTGTTNDSKDAWFCGFNTRLATAIWMGYWTPTPMYGVQGATYCVPIFGRFYNLVFDHQSLPDFPYPAAQPIWKPWKGHYSTIMPSPSPSSPSPSPSGSGKGQPTPTITKTIKPSPTPTKTTPPPSPKPTPSKTASP